MEIEFLDPGPDQPDGPGTPDIAGDNRPAQPRTGLDRETIGLLVMLVAAALLPAVAAFQNLYSVDERGGGNRFSYGVDAWGRFRFTNGFAFAPGQHEPRFGILLCICGACFAVVALAIAAQALLHHPRDRRVVGSAAAGGAGVLVGLQVGITASMALQIETIFDRLRAATGTFDADQSNIRLGVGAAIWLSLAGVLAGGLAVGAALRLRRTDRLPHTAITGGAAGY